MLHTARHRARRGTSSLEYALLTAGAVAMVALLPALLGPVLDNAFAAAGNSLGTQIAALARGR